MTNKVNPSNLSSIYKQLNKYPLTDFTEAAQNTKDLNEREFHMMVLGFMLRQRQRKLLPKKGRSFFNV